MGGDFRVWPLLVGALQKFQGPRQVAQAELHPSEAVGDVGVARGVFQGFLDQLPGFLQLHAAICQDVAQRVVGVVVVRLAGDDLAQQLFHHFLVAGLFGQHGLVIEQIVVLRCQGDQTTLQLIGVLVLLGVAQQLHLGREFHALVFGCRGRQALDQCPSVGQAPLPSQQRGAPHLGAEEFVAVVDACQPGLGFVEALALLGDLGVQQVGLGEAGLARFFLRQLFGQGGETLQGGLRRVQTVVLYLQGGLQ